MKMGRDYTMWMGEYRIPNHLFIKLRYNEDDDECLCRDY